MATGGMARVFIVASCIGVALAASSGPFYVAPDGNDAWTGTLPDPAGDDGPFLTPARAAAAVLAVPRPLTGDVHVWIRAGVYSLEEALALSGPLAGGDGQGAVVRWGKYAADSGDAVLSGAASVIGWTPTATTGIWRAALPGAAPPRCRELFVAGQRAWPARVPPIAGPSRDDSFSDASTLHYTSSLSGCGFSPPSCFPSSCPAGDEWGWVNYEEQRSEAAQAQQRAHTGPAPPLLPPLLSRSFVYNASDPRGPSPAWADIPGIDVVAFGAWTAAWSPVKAVLAVSTKERERERERDAAFAYGLLHELRASTDGCTAGQPHAADDVAAELCAPGPVGR